MRCPFCFHKESKVLIHELQKKDFNPAPAGMHRMPPPLYYV